MPPRAVAAKVVSRSWLVTESHGAWSLGHGYDGRSPAARPSTSRPESYARADRLSRKVQRVSSALISVSRRRRVLGDGERRRRRSRGCSPTASSFRAAAGRAAKLACSSRRQPRQHGAAPGSTARGRSRAGSRSASRSAAVAPALVGMRSAEHPRGLEVLRIVQQHERLQRRVRPLPPHDAERALRRVEADGRGRRRRSASTRCRGCGGAGRRRAPARRSSRCASRAPPRGPAGWYGYTLVPPIVRDEQPAHRERVVADLLGGPAVRGSAGEPAGWRDPSSRSAARRRRRLAVGRGQRRSAFTAPSGPSRDSTKGRRRASRAARGASAARPGCRSPRRCATMPVPKNIAHSRLTTTRAVSGCRGSKSHCASPRRFFGRLSENGRMRARRPGLHADGRGVVRAAREDEGGARPRQLAHHHHLRARRQHGVLLSAGLVSAAWAAAQPGTWRRTNSSRRAGVPAPAGARSASPIGSAAPDTDATSRRVSSRS